MPWNHHPVDARMPLFFNSSFPFLIFIRLKTAKYQQQNNTFSPSVCTGRIYNSVEWCLCVCACLFGNKTTTGSVPPVLAERWTGSGTPCRRRLQSWSGWPRCSSPENSWGRSARSRTEVPAECGKDLKGSWAISVRINCKLTSKYKQTHLIMQ